MKTAKSQVSFNFQGGFRNAQKPPFRISFIEKDGVTYAYRGDERGYVVREISDINTPPDTTNIIIPDMINNYEVKIQEIIRRCLPANVAYMFNYEDNPNEGYFFIDLVEEIGTLMKPPYDPRREGYQFAGWYKDAECTEEWDFETDEVLIQFDEEGNRIYEEIKLYAKWVEG